MKTFENRKAEKKFVEILEAIESPLQREHFVDKVKALRDEKIISEDGEFSCFFVTERDLMALAKTV